MDIKQKDDGSKGSFYIEVDGEEEGVLNYVWAGPDKIIISHTEVEEALKGKNAGKQLVHKAVEFAREKGIKIMPLCPFATAIFKKTPDYRDVLA
jgi:predicted GNAT family acetyltransferase